jgi:hypothetical protein
MSNLLSVSKVQKKKAPSSVNKSHYRNQSVKEKKDQSSN